MCVCVCKDNPAVSQSLPRPHGRITTETSWSTLISRQSRLCDWFLRSGIVSIWASSLFNNPRHVTLGRGDPDFSKNLSYVSKCARHVQDFLPFEGMQGRCVFTVIPSLRPVSVCCGVCVCMCVCVNVCVWVRANHGGPGAQGHFLLLQATVSITPVDGTIQG